MHKSFDLPCLFMTIPSFFSYSLHLSYSYKFYNLFIHLIILFIIKFFLTSSGRKSHQNEMKIFLRLIQNGRQFAREITVCKKKYFFRKQSYTITGDQTRVVTLIVHSLTSIKTNLCYSNDTHLGGITNKLARFKLKKNLNN